MNTFLLYGDAGGHPSDRPCVIVAGFLATEAQWRGFGPDWAAALLEHDLGDVFHMTDFERLYRNNPKRGAILECLTRIITRHTASSFSCIVDMAAYRKINETHNFEESIGAPYALACRGLAKSINEWKAKKLAEGDSLRILLERGTKHHGDMQQVFQRDVLPIPEEIPKAHPCVQPADMLAWEIYHAQYFKQGRKSLKNLLLGCATSERQHTTFDEVSILRTCAMLPETVPLMPRSEIPAGARFSYHSTPNRPRKRTVR